MRVRVLLFARPREIVGAGQVELDVDDGATPATVFAALTRTHEDLAGLRDNLRVAIDQAYGGWDAPLREDAEVAFIPPTAGG